MNYRMLPLVMVLAVPVLACAQNAHAQQGPRRPPTSLELLLENREALALTPEQVGQVSELSQSLEEQNAPLHQQLQALRPSGPPPDRSAPGATPPEAEALRAVMAQARAVFQELEANDSAAYAKAEAVLTREQQARASQLITQAREEAQRQRAARHERRRGRQ